MRAYYLNPRIDAAGLKELDALSDKHAKACKEGLASCVQSMTDYPPGHPVHDSAASLAGILVAQLILFG